MACFVPVILSGPLSSISSMAKASTNLTTIGYAQDKLASVQKLNKRSRVRIAMTNANQEQDQIDESLEKGNGQEFKDLRLNRPEISRRRVLYAGMLAPLSLLAMTALPETARADGAGGGWDYQEHGPNKWADLNPKFKLCADISHQSPIDLTSKDSKRKFVTAKEVPKIVVVNREATFKGVRRGTTGAFTFTPQTAGDARAAPVAKLVLPNGAVYRLLQFHFHADSSEHAMEGRKGASEVHFVWGLEKKGSNPNIPATQPKNAVIGIVFNEGPTDNVFIEATYGSIWKKGNNKVKEGDVFRLDVGSVIPSFEKNRFFEYKGSLTTPPCSENIQWFVFQNDTTVVANPGSKVAMKLDPNAVKTVPANGPIPNPYISSSQLKKMMALHTHANWRPVQIAKSNSSFKVNISISNEGISLTSAQNTEKKNVVASAAPEKDLTFNYPSLKPVK